MKKVDLQFSLPVTIIREGDTFIAYSPALDLSTAGDTFEESKKRFEEAVEIFFEEITEKGTFEEALLELGWQKHDHKLTPPVVVSSKTETFSVSHPPYTKYA